MSDSVDALPLDGMRVLDLADGRLLGVGRLFADLGADVVRAEPPGGSPDRAAGVTDGGVGLTFAEHLMRSADAAEGMRAFAEKRAPQWTGR